MKKILAILLILASIACCFTACENKKTDKSEDKELKTTVENNLLESFCQSGTWPSETEYINKKINLKYDFTKWKDTWKQVPENEAQKFMETSNLPSDFRLLMAAKKYTADGNNVVIFVHPSKENETPEDFLNRLCIENEYEAEINPSASKLFESRGAHETGIITRDDYSQKIITYRAHAKENVFVTIIITAKEDKDKETGEITTNKVGEIVEAFSDAIERETTKDPGAPTGNDDDKTTGSSDKPSGDSASNTPNENITEEPEDKAEEAEEAEEAKEAKEAKDAKDAEEQSDNKDSNDDEKSEPSTTTEVVKTPSPVPGGPISSTPDDEN